MRRTAKYLAGLKTLGAKRELSHQALYDTLEGRGYWWDATQQKWLDTPKPSTSAFAQDGAGDIPSGVVMIRVMAHPAQIEEAANEVVDLLGEDWMLIQQSGQYPNRKGVGVRVYLTFKKGVSA